MDFEMCSGVGGPMAAVDRWSMLPRMPTRREMIQSLASATGALVIAPAMTSALGGCSAEPEPQPEPQPEPTAGQEEVVAAEAPLEVPRARPEAWDPIAFNRTRGNQGAIPESYLESINGPDGDTAHLGKHLPYVPEVDAALVPEGMLAIMWGDPSKGHAKHPNAPVSEENPDGHWYDWIRVRAATDDEAPEAESRFTSWPLGDQDDSGQYAVQGEGEITDESGKNTIYLVQLPEGVRPGDGTVLRVYAHCLTHGEYVDFVEV